VRRRAFFAADAERSRRGLPLSGLPARERRTAIRRIALKTRVNALMCIELGRHFFIFCLEPSTDRGEA
jgi:hypothetical protein